LTARRLPGRLRPAARRVLGAGALLLAVLLLAGCGDGAQSSFDTNSEPSRLIERLFWWMVLGAAVVFGGAVALLAISWFRRSRSGIPLFGEREPVATTAVVTFGIVIPILTLAGLFTAANVLVMRKTNAPAPSSTSMTIEVVGRQWFWEFRYPGTDAVTANELHVPTQTRINLVVHTADVIHSFWVPQLNRKIDAIPGKSNRILLYADAPGTYRGQCSEFCGLQHAHMSLRVHAEPKAQFDGWLRNEASPAPEPASAEAARGRDVFMSEACASCHTIRGTEARGEVGPDLTHVGGRQTLAALTIPNTAADMAKWITNPQAVKPGNKMPGLRLTPDETKAIVAYLQRLE